MVTPNPENNFSQQALVKFINRKIIEIADQSDTGDLFHGLSAYIYDFIVDARSKNYNPRNILASEDHGDLLYEDEVERDPEKRWPCLYELYICLLDSLELERQPDTDVPTGKPEAPNKSQYEVGLMEHQDIGAFDSLASDQQGTGSVSQQVDPQMDLLRQASVAIVGLIGGHSARLDSSVKAAKSVWTWCNKMMPTRYSPEDIAPLRVVQYFATAAAQQSDISLLQASFMETANESRVQLGLPHTFDECDGASDSLYYHQLVLIHLTGTLASVLSVEHLRKGTSDRATTSNPRDDLHRWFKNNVEAWFPEGHEMALFQQSYGRILLTLGEFKFAQHEIRKALDHAQPHMLHTIEACRQIQLAIDLEEQSRVSTEEQIKSKVNEEATKAIESRMKETDKRIKELTKLEQEIKDTRIQISNSQLRVVEVLGVFLAVAGIAVTSVGGIAVEGSIPVRIAIWFAGYGSLVSLFFLLRLIVGKSPSQDNGETPEGAPGDEST